jgi:hypothetical protein
VSADSIVPGAGKPQALNRYAYVFNNPLKYVDPSGHTPCYDDEGSGQSQSQPPPPPTPQPSGGEGSKSKTPPSPWYQDVLDFIDTAIPSHAGYRLEGNIGAAANFIPLGATTGPGPQDILGVGGGFNVPVGINFMCNRHSKSCGTSVDIGVQGQATAGTMGPTPGKSINVVYGPLVGWNAPSLETTLVGYSIGPSVAGCALLCIENSVSVAVKSAPTEYQVQGKPVEKPDGLYINPQNGAPAFTSFLGFGVGTLGAGVGGGGSYGWEIFSGRIR